MVAMWKKDRGRGGAARGRLLHLVVPGDRLADEQRANDLAEMFAASLASREAALADGMRAATEILAAAAERDAVADARDAAADKRDRELDLAALLGGRDYGADWPARGAGALDREHPKEDRIPARAGLRALGGQFRPGGGLPGEANADMPLDPIDGL